MVRKYFKYQDNDEKNTYSDYDFYFCLTQYAKDYIAQGVNLNIESQVRDAILADSINYFSNRLGVNLVLHVDELYVHKKYVSVVDPECLLDTVLKYYSFYMFSHNMVDSILNNKKIYQCETTFDVSDAISILINFINYISKVNNFGRIFTVKELYNQYCQEQYKQDMLELKEFLRLVARFGQLTLMGKNVQSILEMIGRENDLHLCVCDNKYRYVKKEKRISGFTKVIPVDSKKVDDCLYALAYFCGKQGNQEIKDIDILSQKVLEMKKN